MTPKQFLMSGAKIPFIDTVSEIGPVECRLVRIASTTMQQLHM